MYTHISLCYYAKLTSCSIFLCLRCEGSVWGGAEGLWDTYVENFTRRRGICQRCEDVYSVSTGNKSTRCRMSTHTGRKWSLVILFNVVLIRFCITRHITVKSAHKEPANKELPVIRNWLLFLNLYQGTSSLYIYKELRL